MKKNKCFFLIFIDFFGLSNYDDFQGGEAVTIGAIIQAARKKAGLTQSALGERIGVSGSMIAQWENNLRTPKSQNLGKIITALGTNWKDAFSECLDSVEQQARGIVDAVDIQGTLRLLSSDSDYIKQLKKDIRAFVTTEQGRSIISAYMALNETGRRKAFERITELTEVPKYRKNEKSE